MTPTVNVNEHTTYLLHILTEAICSSINQYICLPIDNTEQLKVNSRTTRSMGRTELFERQH